MIDAVEFWALYAGGRKFAHSAMEANAESDVEVFLLHAGVSIERLAKAALVQKSPFLLLEMKGKEDSLFHLAGVKETTKLRTIGAMGALSRLRTMNILPPKDTDLDELIELRNGVAHLTPEAGDTLDALATFARTTNTLLSHLQIEQFKYWEKWHGTVAIALSEHLERVEREVAARIESARFRLSKRLEGLPQEAVDMVFANAQVRGEGEGFGVNLMCGDFTIRLPLDCPACRCEGTLILGLPKRSTDPLTAPARGFYCPLCGFGMDDEEELGAIGVGPDVPVVDSEGKSLVPFNPSEYSDFFNGGTLSRAEIVALWALASAAPEDDTIDEPGDDSL
ncbi:hypothetical protein [Streptomyces milbemycinicus]|uniref:hypothetical protein n=1 Tax=Streptomyces milbemycinicus TaxID=476552 RepID=UPI00340D2092